MVDDTFGEVIACYARKQAIEDELLVDVSKLAREAGFRCPTVVTRSVFERYVRVPDKAYWQDEDGRLWDILWMLRNKIRCLKPADCSRVRELTFGLYVQQNENPPEPVTLKAVTGPGDDGELVLTIMLPGED